MSHVALHVGPTTIEWLCEGEEQGRSRDRARERSPARVVFLHASVSLNSLSQSLEYATRASATASSLTVGGASRAETCARASPPLFPFTRPRSRSPLEHFKAVWGTRKGSSSSPANH